MEKEKLQTIYDMMPEGWKEAAKEKKALVRSRKIRTPEELLRLNLLYQTSGGSYGLTAAMTQISENQNGLNKTAVAKRIVNSGEWLRWICEHMCKAEGYLVEPPEWLRAYRVCIADGSDFALKGSNGTDFRLHYMTELFTLNMTEFHFTDAKIGETLTRYTQIQKDDLIIADRGYGTITGITHILSKEAQYLLRLKANSFTLYDNLGTPLDLTEQLRRNWEPGKVLEYHAYFRKGKELLPIRICAMGKTQEQFEKSQRNSTKCNHGRKKASALQSIWNRYIVVATSLPEAITAEQVLELYQMRWQIELVFKRFKSIFKGDTFAVQKQDTVQAWFYGKLLLAILSEALAKRGHFSPSDEGKEV